MAYDVIWDGVNRGDGSDLLCISLPSVPTSTSTREAHFDPTRGKADWTEQRVAVLALLRQRETWQIKELRAAVGMDSKVLHGFIQRWIGNGTIRRTGYGCYRLVERSRS